METIILISIWLLNLVFDFLEGAREAIFFKYCHSLLKVEENKALHKAFLIVRTTIGMMVMLPLILVLKYDYLAIFCFASSLMLTFIYVHDGAYYWVRNALDPSVYPKK